MPQLLRSWYTTTALLSKPFVRECSGGGVYNVKISRGYPVLIGKNNCITHHIGKISIMKLINIVFVLTLVFGHSAAVFNKWVRASCGAAEELCEIELNVTLNETMKIFDSTAVPQADPVYLESGNRMHVRKCSTSGQNSNFWQINSTGDVIMLVRLLYYSLRFDKSGDVIFLFWLWPFRGCQTFTLQNSRTVVARLNR